MTDEVPEGYTVLHIQLLGGFSLVCDDTPVTSIEWPRLQSLLAYLLLHRHSRQSRTHLASLLWPDSTETQAHTNLRTLLTRLRRALPNADTFLQSDRYRLQWQPQPAHASWTLDVLDFEQALVHAEPTQESCNTRHAFEKAIALYHGNLLPGCYDEWILPERDRLQKAFLLALERLIALQEEDRDYDAAIITARRLLGYDPLHEATYRHLMCLYVSRGDPASALRVYYTCATILERELATEPSPATQEVYERLMQQGTASAPLASAPTPLLATAPLVGRAHEWALLEKVCQQALAGRPHLVLLSGEAGIGKTRLAEELLASVERQGLSTASARCYVAEGEASYAPVAEWFRAEPLRRSLSALAALWLTEVARVLPEILLERPDLPSPEPLTESWQCQRFREALARATLGARQPLLLLLDDLQWCDQETLTWLHYLLRFDPQARCLLIATVRPEEITTDHPLESWLASMQRTGQLSEIALGPLDATNTALLAGALTRGDIDQEASATLYQETEGNPLFVVETVRMGLLGGGTSQRSSGKTPATSDALLPPTVQAVIAARLVQLSPLAKELVSLAAVIGRAFTWSVLEQASHLDEEKLVRGLDELWRKRIVREQGEDAYDFSHDKLRVVAYAELSTARLRLLHRRVAETLEALYADALDQVSGRIASHLEQAGRVEEAITYYRRAAEAAGKLFANAETLALYKRAVLLLETACPTADQQWRWEQLAQLHESVGDVLTLTGYHSEARTAYQSSLALVPAHAGIWQARLLRKIGQTLGIQEQFDQEWQAYDRAEAALTCELPGRTSVWWQTWIDIHLSRIERSYYRSQIQEMTERIELTRPVVQQYGLPTQRAAFLRSLFLWSIWRDWCTGRRERYMTSEETLGYAQAMLTARLDMGNDREVGWARWSLGVARLWHGDLDEAEEQLHAGLALGERAGDVTLQARCLGNVIYVHRNRGQVEATRRASMRALAFATEIPMPYYIGMAKANLAWVAWHEGNLAEARELGRTALALWSQSSIFIPVRWTALWPLIGTELAQERLPEAMAYAQMLLAPGHHLPPEALSTIVEAALAKWDAGQQDTARRELDQATMMAQQMGYM